MCPNHFQTIERQINLRVPHLTLQNQIEIKSELT